jgi:signal transduction histidine kinase
VTSLPNNAYVGAVFLTEELAPDLRMLVNREGFVPDEGFEQLETLVRRGIDLNVRLQAASPTAERLSRQQQRALQSGARDSTALLAAEQAVGESVTRSAQTAREARSFLSAGDVSSASEVVSALIDELTTAEELVKDAVSERALLRVLASVGTQMAAFVHEIRAIVGLAQSLVRSLERIAGEFPEVAFRLRPLQAEMEDLRRRVEREATYLTDVVSIDARRSRARQGLRSRFAAAAGLVEPSAERRGIRIENEIPQELRSPPMYPAEITSVFSNLLTNAVKAAGEQGVIRATGRAQGRGSVVRVENTGVRVPPADGERWFRPFASTTVRDIDPVLGQGMGLGLPITRSMLQDYRASLRFVEPDDAFATALEITFP